MHSCLISQTVACLSCDFFVLALAGTWRCQKSQIHSKTVLRSPSSRHAVTEEADGWRQCVLSSVLAHSDLAISCSVTGRLSVNENVRILVSFNLVMCKFCLPLQTSLSGNGWIYWGTSVHEPRCRYMSQKLRECNIAVNGYPMTSTSSVLGLHRVGGPHFFAALKPKYVEILTWWVHRIGWTPLKVFINHL